MVHETWVGQHYNTRLGRTTLWLYHTLRAPYPQFAESLQQYRVKTWALIPKTCLGGIPCPTGPQHKHRDLPLSHSVEAVIMVWSPSNCSWIVLRSAVHWVVACCICCICCSKTSMFGVLLCINVCIPYMCVSFPSMFSVIVKASLIQGWTYTLRTASLCHATSTCSFSALACCILAIL